MVKFEDYDYDALSVEVWNDNYRQPDEIVREDTWNRVAEACAKIENSDVRTKIEEDFKKILYNDRFVPGGRILSNIGNTDRKNTTLFNCYVHNPKDIGLKDCDSIDGIYDLLKAQAKTLQSEGGFGVNASWLRPAGTYIEGIGSRTPGPIKFMELWDKSSEIITVGSNKIRGSREKSEKIKIRKGAMMLVLNVWHPDIKEFITAKQTPGVLTKFNMSVGITEGFMNAVIEDSMWELKYPDTKHPKYKEEWFGFIEEWEEKGYPVIVHETIKAKDIWNLIMESTYNRAEPGVLFLDTYNKLNPLYYSEKIATTNPCQPSWTKVLTPNGIREFNDVNIGDVIWSNDGWTKIINKWSSGIKDVYKAKTTIGDFYSTENHRVVSKGTKVELSEAKSIDICNVVNSNTLQINIQDIMDGLVFGDGSVHKASNDLVYFIVGENDGDYFTDPVSEYFIKYRPGIKPGSYEVKTTITSQELPKTFDRVIPTRFVHGDSSKVSSFLRGLFSANGSISGERVTLKAASFKVISDVMMMLSSLGIKSYYTTNKTKSQKFSNGVYQMKESYDINITHDRDVFFDKIGFIQKYKNEKLKTLINTLNKSYKKKISYEILNYEKFSTEEVFDITVDNESHTYWSFGFNTSNCGEIGMATGVCNLGSINLTQFIKNSDAGLYFDFDEFEETVKIAVRFLDNINSISTTPLPEYDQSVIDRRRIGLGVLGLGSMHIMLGIPFGSEESLTLQEKIAKIKCETELVASALLGKEKGSFKLFDKEKYFNSLYFNTLPISDDTKKKLIEIGEMRNSHQSMNAPTGNTGIYARNVSGGIEPVFSVDGYFRWCIVPEFRQRELIDSNIKFPNVHKGEWFETDNFKFSMRGSEQILKGTVGDKNYEIDKNRGLTVENFVEDFGVKYAKHYYMQNYDDMKANKIFKDVSNLSVDDHLNSLKIWAKYCNMSISKTVNLPNNYTYENFQNVYMDAWKNNIKGITTYREGTMTAVLETKDNKKNNTTTEKISYTNAPKRPEILECDIHQVKIKGESWTIFIGKLDGLPYEIFGGSEKYIKIPKVYNKGMLQKDAKKNDMNSQYNLFYGEEGKETIIKDIVSVFENPLYNYHTRSLSMKLRHGIPILFIVDMLQRDELGSELYSFNKVIARVLKTYIKDGTKKKGKCPNCGGERLVMQEGCFVCQDCSYSKCS